MSVKLNSAAGGSVTINEPSTASDFNITMPAASGNVVLNPVIAGTTSQAPIIFTPGTNLTVPYPGAIEYDGKVFYATPQGTQRGVVPGAQFYRLANQLTGANDTSNQNILGVGATVSGSTTYAFELLFTAGRTSGTTSHTFALAWGGTATTTSVHYIYQVIYTTDGTLTNNTFYGNRAATASFPATTVITPAITSATYGLFVIVKGTFTVNAGGTLIPQYKLSAAPGSAYYIEAGSYMSIYPVGSSAGVNVGTWA